MLSNQSQLLARNLDLFEQGEWLIINPADAYFTDQLSDMSLEVLHQYFDIFSESVRVINCHSMDTRDVSQDPAGFGVTQKVSKHIHTFAPFVTGERRFSDILIYIPKAKHQLKMLLTMAGSVLRKGGRIHLVGENKGGIKSAGKLAVDFGQAQKVDSARHCSLITIDVENTPAFRIDDWLDESTYQIDEFEWDIVSLPGVFSHTELDEGTRLLLSKLPSHLNGGILDFACGAGVIGAYLNKLQPHLKLTLLDVSALALFCAARTMQANGLSGQLLAANGLHGVEDKFNHIVTNPPFHTGVKTDYSITKRFISDAKRILIKDGTLHLVANRFLPYPGLLAEHFSQVRPLAQTTQFSVYLSLK